METITRKQVNKIYAATYEALRQEVPELFKTERVIFTISKISNAKTGESKIAVGRKLHKRAYLEFTNGKDEPVNVQHLWIVNNQTKTARPAISDNWYTLKDFEEDTDGGAWETEVE